MGAVVQLRLESASVVDVEVAFDQAWMAYPVEGRRRSSTKLSRRAWDVAAREVGDAALLIAVRRYVAEDKDHKRECGPPAFHRWLSWGRYEHWLPTATPQITGATFSDPKLRAALRAVTSEDFVAAYLDPCQVDGTTLLTRTGIAGDRLKPYGQIFRAHGFTGMRKAVDGAG